MISLPPIYTLLPTCPFSFFFFNDTATTEIYTLSHTTLFRSPYGGTHILFTDLKPTLGYDALNAPHQSTAREDRKSTRLNSSHDQISYAVFCLRKKEHTSELQSRSDLVCRLLLEKKKTHE